jgi:hypothetical protein
MWVPALVVTLLLLPAALAGAQPPPTAQTAIDRAFARLYNFDFVGAETLLNEHARVDPGDPLTSSVRAAAYLFVEFDRLKILQTEFFEDDENLIDDRPLKPDPVLRAKLFDAVAQSRARAQAILALRPDDRDALFAMCMSAGVVTDYTGFVERRQWRGMTLARQANAYAERLLALTPPVYDAYHTTGTLEYVVGSMPFYLRWFVHYKGIEGDKRKGIEEIKLVARHGRFYGPFARILLVVASLREGKLDDARQLLTGLCSEFPENPLLRRELARVTERIQRANRVKTPQQ